MAQRKILTIGFEISSDDTEYCDFKSNISLLDWDIILFKPTITEFMSYSSHFQGKPSLSDTVSFKLKECCEHWRREIKDSFESGKTIVVFLSDLEEMYIDTGRREYSGTGRNQKTTRMVDLYDNYKSIPATLKPIKTKGSAIKLAARGSEIISSYWRNFESYSQYKVILSAENIPACLLTKTGDKPVGAIFRSKNSAGAIVLVPDIDFYKKEFFEEKDNEEVWTEDADGFAARMIHDVVSLDKALKSIGELTPEPEWSKSTEFVLNIESKTRSELLIVEEGLEKLQAKKEELLDELKKSGRLRNLLFEKGKPLENAIIDGLEILGFNTSQYHDSESEFDVVFESHEGRLIGEAEGKDNKPINVDKLRQLSMNIHEDLARDDVVKPAKAVLFGNAFRLEPLNQRKDPFTDKCISAAISASTALVFTPDLFKVALYLTNNKDSIYASKCRKAIINAAGRVEFPKLPTKGNVNP